VFKTESKVGESATARAWTDSEKWNWTDQGTEPHVIRPRRARVLRFAVGGKPKTKVRTLGSGRGKRGNRWVTKKVVHHPGTTARHFSEEVQTRRRHYFYRDMLKANTDGVIKACKG